MVQVASWQLKQRQSLPLEAKIRFSEIRIQSWYSHWNGDVYVSFSGGKDSTVLLHIVRSLYPHVPAVFVDTGLEFPEIRDFVRTVDNVVWLKPKMNFKEVLETYGYPVISKENATYLREIRSAQRSGAKNWVKQRMFGRRRDGGRTSFCLSKKWHFMVNAPFDVSEKCCDVMKKRPFHKYTKKTGRHAIIGVMATDSSLRRQQYLKYGCNSFDAATPMSKPLSAWVEDDIWGYIHKHNLPYSSIYDMGYTRTGCVFCMFGVHMEKGENRFQRLKRTHPKLWDYCINKLGLKTVLDYIHIPYNPEPKIGALPL